MIGELESVNRERRNRSSNSSEGQYRISNARASASTQSNSSSRIRRSSRTSSAGGDCIAIDTDVHRLAASSIAKFKPLSPKRNSNSVPSDLKNSKKSFLKSRRPTFSSLRNTVVLAPFYTLKRYFQTKLVDMYFQEKLKKLNNKIKMAKKRNASFEYNVIEIKPTSDQMKKKEVSRRRKPIPRKAKKKRTNSSRSRSSYCQCEKTCKSRQTESRRNAFHDLRTIRKTTTSRMTNRPKSDIQNFYFPRSNNKKIRIKKKIYTAATFKNDFDLKYLNSNERLALRNGSSNSNASSNVDSWETFSDSLSVREERMEGSLVISTTSFDSCLEQKKKPALASPDRNPIRYGGSGMHYSDRFKFTNEFDKGRSGLPGKPKANGSRHFAMNVDTRGSDDRISDFMDREPQTHGIIDTDIPQKLQPLPHLTRTKGKKTELETGPPNNYCPRSVEEGVQVGDEMNGCADRGANGNGTVEQLESFRTSTSSSRPGTTGQQNARGRLGRSMNDPSEEENDFGRNDSPAKAVENAEDKRNRFHFLTQTKVLEESRNRGTDGISDLFNSGLSDSDKKKLGHGQQEKTTTGIIPVEPSCEVLFRKSNHSEQEDPFGNQSQTEKNSEERKVIEIEEANGNFWNPTIGKPPSFQEETFKDLTKEFLPLRGDDQHMFESPSLANIVDTQPENKEHNFIFGPGSKSAR